jgi:hypothetical protein
MPTDDKNIKVGGSSSHIEEIGKSFPINHDAYVEAKEDALSEGKPTWQVIRENIHICVVVVAVQVGSLLTFHSHHNLNLFVLTIPAIFF